MLRFGLPDRYVTHGKPALLREEVGLTPEAVAGRWPRPCSSHAARWPSSGISLGGMRVWAAGLAMVVSLLVVAPGASAQSRVDSGSIAASVGADPWRLTFLQRDGRRESVALSESTSRGSGPTGSLGFRTLLGWRRATRVLETRRDGSALALVLATTDPTGRRMSARIEPAGEGGVRVSAAVLGYTGDVTASGIAFDARGRERYLGFGERSNAVDQRGNEVENFVSDGPYHPDDRIFLQAVRPSAGLPRT